MNIPKDERVHHPAIPTSAMRIPPVHRKPHPPSALLNKTRCTKISAKSYFHKSTLNPIPLNTLVRKVPGGRALPLQPVVNYKKRLTPRESGPKPSA